MANKHFSFHLHAHLPWVIHHGHWPHGAEWICEGVVETYIPLVRAMRRLRDKGIAGGLTLSVSPVLAEQLGHTSFPTLLKSYIEERITTGRDDVARFAKAGQEELAGVARHWERFHVEARDFFFDTLGADLIGALRDLEDSGTLELATCAATHGYLPLLGRDESIALQLELARAVHRRHFGRAPRGIWLPEMAYRPAGTWHPPTGRGVARERIGIEEHVAAAEFRYFPVDAGLVLGGRGVGSYRDQFRSRDDLRREAAAESPPRPRPDEPRDTRLSYWVAREGGAQPNVACFPRDPRTSLQVWSGEHGYPGDGAYLEFHKKSDSGGQRYWRITGSDVDLADKAIYSPEEAAHRVGSHADHFAALVASCVAGAADGAILTAPYDAELFGHWWCEGIDWIEGVLERLHEHPSVELTTLGEHREKCPPETVVALPEGSWGEGGHHYVWRNPRVDWTWDLVHPAEDELWRLRAEAVASRNPLALRLTRAMARQLLVLSGSDWAFLITTDGAADYASQRVRHHADDLARLADLSRQALGGKNGMPEASLAFLEEVEERDDLFPELEDALLTAASRGETPAPDPAAH